MNEITFAGPAPSETKQYLSRRGYTVICCSGRGKIITDNAEYPYESGDVAVVPPLLHHCNDGAETDLYTVLERAMLSYRNVCIIRGDGADELTEACRKAKTYYGEQRNGKGLVLSALGGLIAALIASYIPGKGLSPVVANVIAEIEKNLSYPDWALEDCMRAMPLNYDYIRKLFKKEVGLTPREYLTAKRMERAKCLILSGMTNKYSNYTVSQIAEMCGYSEPLYFSRVFKKFFGVSPSDYR